MRNLTMEPVDPARDLRKGLVVRLAIAAGVLVAGLIGLAWLGGSPPDFPQQVSGTLVPIEPAAPAEVAAPPTVEAEPAASSPKSVPEQPVATATPVPAEESSRKAAATSPVAEPGQPERAGNAAGNAPALARRQETAAPPRNKPPRGPHLQAGVFIQPANAEDFKAKLEAEGLPVYIESRVQIGPFKNRKEAERMREKLKAQGLTTVLIAQ